MKNRYFALLLLILATTTFLKSQSAVFAPIGAKWTYNKNSEIYQKPYGTEQYRYVVLKDTIVFGWNARIVEGEIWTDGAFVTYPLMRRYVSVTGDKVYHLVDSTFEMLYDFGAKPGDTVISAVNGNYVFYNPGYNPPVPPYRYYFSYVIDSTGTIEVQGTTLRTQYIHNSHDMFTDPWQIQGLFASPDEPIIERIGSFPSASWFGSGYNFIPPEGDLSTFRCYQDDEIYFEGNTLGLPCDSVVGVQIPEQIRFRVGPNPFATIISINIPWQFESLSFRLFNSVGNMVLQHSLAAGTNIIPAGGLHGTFYFWQIIRGNTILESGQLIKSP